ncbi:MAG TPA: hypothetical protein DEB31_04420 [Clostridiales bacterium]|nr:hypothetical protein [Clostridiales bacterium]HCC34339.1 hypothetical protein [Oscillospiraceae bacterium]
MRVKGGEDVFKSYTREYSDRSDEKTFRFDFYCDVCGEVFSATPLECADRGPPPDTAEGERLRKLLWRQEHAKAFERANYEALDHFFLCPMCGSYVCDKCTVYKKDRDGDMARICCVGCKRRVRPVKRKGYKAAELKYVPSPSAPPKNM